MMFPPTGGGGGPAINDVNAFARQKNSSASPMSKIRTNCEVSQAWLSRIAGSMWPGRHCAQSCWGNRPLAFAPQGTTRLRGLDPIPTKVIDPDDRGRNGVGSTEFVYRLSLRLEQEVVVDDQCATRR